MLEDLASTLVIGLRFRQALLRLPQVAAAVVAVAQVATVAALGRELLDKGRLHHQGFPIGALRVLGPVRRLEQDAQVVPGRGQALPVIGITRFRRQQRREVAASRVVSFLGRRMPAEHLLDLAGADTGAADLPAQRRVVAVVLEEAILELQDLLEDVAAHQLQVRLAGQALVADLRQLIDRFPGRAVVGLRPRPLPLGDLLVFPRNVRLHAGFRRLVLGTRPLDLGELLQRPGLHGPGLLQPGEQGAADGHAEQQQHAHPKQRRAGRVSPRPLPGALAGGRRPGQDRLAVQEAAQVVGQGSRGCVAVGRLLLQALQADRLQVARHLGLEPPRRHRLIRAHLFQSVEQRRPLEGRPAGQQLVEDRAQGVDVGGAGRCWLVSPAACSGAM